MTNCCVISTIWLVKFLLFAHEKLLHLAPYIIGQVHETKRVLKAARDTDEKDEMSKYLHMKPK